MDHQDFKEVVLTKKRPTGTGTGGGTLKDQRAVANVRRLPFRWMKCLCSFLSSSYWRCLSFFLFSSRTRDNKQALRQGLNVTAVKKDVSNVNKAGPGRNALKLENETEELTHKTVNAEVKKAIMQGRLAKKLTQAQLAQQINERPQVIQEYESGKAIPNQQILGKLERVLGVKLRGKGMR